ncbi:MAG: peptidoglycan-binding domain-containing protein [Gammaproteobacteria bacterium]|nr:peptidoglycan-binding domain-containing protein [Gammaproteobacteria bacterium]
MKAVIHPLLPTLFLALHGCALLPDGPTTLKQDPASAAPASAVPAPLAPAAITPPQAESPSLANPSSTAAPALSTPGPTPIIRAGECWVQAVVQPKPVRKPLEIVVRDAVNDIEVTPPVLKPARKEIVIREGGLTYRIEPPVYKRVVEKVLVRPEVRRSVVVPAVFEEREVQVEIEGARTVVERCTSSTARRTAESLVQMLCAREIPAKTQTIKRKILVQPETTREVVEPAVYKDVTRWVIETPARAVPVDLPPRTASLKVREITRPEQVEEQQIPAKIKRLLTTAYEGEPSLVFRQAVCDQDLSPALVRDLQHALKQSGFDPGATDGKFGDQTFRALLNYQRQHGLAQGALTYESLEHLGINPKR